MCIIFRDWRIGKPVFLHIYLIPLPPRLHYRDLKISWKCGVLFWVWILQSLVTCRLVISLGLHRNAVLVWYQHPYVPVTHQGDHWASSATIKGTVHKEVSALFVLRSSSNISWSTILDPPTSFLFPLFTVDQGQWWVHTPERDALYLSQTPPKNNRSKQNQCWA